VGAAFRLAVTLAVIVLLVWGASALAVIGFAHRDNARPADAIVVLGAAQWDGRPSPVLRARLDHSIRLWRRRIAPQFIMTGGFGPGDTVSEAAVARKYVQGRGVPEDKILLETQGRTTSESMRAVAAILHSRGLERAVLVSDRFHMFRLWVLAQRYGFAGHTSPAQRRPFDPTPAEREWRYIISESIKAPAAWFLDPAR
jgi:uncharacterized SAM-binding protein YcdF (DUF218 family)